MNIKMKLDVDFNNIELTPGQKSAIEEAELKNMRRLEEDLNKILRIKGDKTGVVFGEW